MESYCMRELGQSNKLNGGQLACLCLQFYNKSEKYSHYNFNTYQEPLPGRLTNPAGQEVKVMEKKLQEEKKLLM